MGGTSRISRKLIAVMPILLVCGIVAQVILLVAVIVLYVPCLVFPGILDGPYLTITKAMARIFAKSIVGKRRDTGRVTQASELSFRNRTRPARCLPPGVSLWYNDHKDIPDKQLRRHNVRAAVDRRRAH